MDKLMKAATASSSKVSNTRLVVMCGNKEVFNINMDEGDIAVVNESLLPFRLKGDLRDIMPYEKITSKYEDTQRIIAIGKNRNAIINWLSSRTLLLSRTNAKKLYQAFRLEQLQDETSRAKLAMSCMALSILDNYCWNTPGG